VNAAVPYLLLTSRSSDCSEAIETIPGNKGVHYFNRYLSTVPSGIYEHGCQ